MRVVGGSPSPEPHLQLELLESVVRLGVGDGSATTGLGLIGVGFLLGQPVEADRLLRAGMGAYKTA